MNLREAKKELEEHGYIVEGSALKSKEEYKAIFEEAHEKIEKDLSFARGLSVAEFDYHDWLSRTELSKGRTFDIVYTLAGLSGYDHKIKVGRVNVSGTGKITYEIYKYKIQRDITSGAKFGVSVYLDNGYREKYGACGNFEGTNAKTVIGPFEKVKDDIAAIIQITGKMANFIIETKDMYLELQR